ncbi:MAG: DUF4870 domain-containing protein [Candidatus Woesearchaeota archaeon]
MAKEVSGESKLFAFLAYLLNIVGFIIVLLAKKDDKFAMYHAKQSLVLFVAWVVLYLVGIVIPLLGWFIILPIGGILLFVLWLFGVINALTGKEKPLPIIGKYGEMLKL